MSHVVFEAFGRNLLSFQVFGVTFRKLRVEAEGFCQCHLTLNAVPGMDIISLRHHSPVVDKLGKMIPCPQFGNFLQFDWYGIRGKQFVSGIRPLFEGTHVEQMIHRQSQCE